MQNKSKKNTHIKTLLISAVVLLTALISLGVQADPAPKQATASMDSAYGQELGCLAMNVYHEARGEPEIGQLAVAAVTMNRVHNKYYPDSVCGVVWQPSQFSWTASTPEFQLIKNSKAWEKSLKIAQRFMDGNDWSGVGKATHYHNLAVSPNWMDKQHLITQLGNHLFYAL